jgi:hypothetical protein
MKSIMVTYRDFQALPKGLKQMLLASESFFFDETNVHVADSRLEKQALAALIGGRLGPQPPLHPSWRN